MNLLTSVLAVMLAQAQPVPSVPAAPPENGVTVSMEVGVGAELGTLDEASKFLPFTVSAGYRFGPRWSADLNLTYAPIIVTGDCPNPSATHVGAALRRHRLSPRIVRPWISIGLGYEKFRQVGGGCTDLELTGFDFQLQVGGDVRLSPSWTVGPFASARVGTYVHRRVHTYDRSGVGAPIDESTSVEHLARHEWFSVGLRGTFGPGPTPTASAESADYRGGFLFMPFLGTYLPVGDSFDAGFRAGFLAGYHILPAFSVNGELAVDFMNVNNLPDLHVKAYVGELLLAPLYHLQLARGEIVVGPRFGGFRLSMVGSGREESAHGLAYGLNLGVFATVGDMGLGFLLACTRRPMTGPGLFGEDYRDWNGREVIQSHRSWSAPDVVSATFAAIF